MTKYCNRKRWRWVYQLRKVTSHNALHCSAGPNQLKWRPAGDDYDANDDYDIDDHGDQYDHGW